MQKKKISDKDKIIEQLETKLQNTLQITTQIKKAFFKNRLYRFRKRNRKKINTINMKY